MKFVSIIDLVIESIVFEEINAFLLIDPSFVFSIGYFLRRYLNEYKGKKKRIFFVLTLAIWCNTIECTKKLYGHEISYFKSSKSALLNRIG